MREIRIEKGKYFEVCIVDTFTGEKIIIDNYNINEQPLTKEEYLTLERVQEILNSDKPLYQFSQQ